MYFSLKTLIYYGCWGCMCVHVCVHMYDVQVQVHAGHRICVRSEDNSVE